MRKITTSAYIPTEIKVENIGNNVAKVIAYPFETGYAVTVAHPLRRLLYTSTVGFAPTAVKIAGVTHEFDSIRGMFEDVAVFIANLKNLRFRLKNDSKREVIEYTFKGSKEIKGADLNNDLVEIVNPDAYLATINEKIIFTITTDGQLSPISAFKNALEAMYQQLSIFTKIVDVDLVSGVVANKQTETHAKLFEKVENLSLSVRSFNCLDKANIRFIGELAVMDEAELKGLKNLGKKSLEEIKSVMEEIGYPVGKDIGDKEVLKKKIAELKNEKIEG